MKPIWLFVAYGGGHVAIIVPLALRARELGLCEPLVLALTTAAPVVRAAGLKTLGFKDFLLPQDEVWLQVGRQLVRQLPSEPADADESAAYLGLSYADMVLDHGEELAAATYEKSGRQAFLPVHFLRRVIGRLQPQLVCATNSPRAEQAALLAAGHLGVPAACVIDLFAVDEKRWIGKRGFADRVCVLNESVRQSLLDMERQPGEVLVTGNPAFDRLFEPAAGAGAAAMRERLGGGARRILLWASQHEPARHPWRAEAGDPTLPGRVLQRLIDYVHSHEGWLLAVRPHPSEMPPQLPVSALVVLTGRDWSLTDLLYACDAVCTLTSTVGLEAHLIGKPVIQVRGSIFEDAAPYGAMGVATAVQIDRLGPALDALPAQGNTCEQIVSQNSTDRVLAVLQQLAREARPF